MCRKKLIFILCGVFFFVFCGGCGQKSSVPQKKRTSKVRKEQQMLAVKTAKSIAPRDTETPPEKGGYGFEKIGAELGYQTYQVPEKELMYFGDPRAQKGGVLTTITPRFPVTLRTVGRNSNYVENGTLGDMLYEGLLKLHPVTMEYIPCLATHWKISEDKMRFSFRINPEARWSDGKPVIAADVVATYDLFMDETILFPSAQLTYSKFERPKAESMYLVSVTSRELNWRNFLYFSLMEILPAHHLKGLTGTEYLKKYQLKILPGTGPYTMLDKDIKNQISYAVTRRLDYWNAHNPLNKYQYNFDKIKFKVVKDNRTLEWEKFKKGEQDFCDIRQSHRWVKETDFEAVKKGWILKRKMITEKPSGTTGYAFNMRKPPFNDRRLRYAFTYLLNREKMNQEMFFNDCIPQNSLYAGSIYENPNNEKIKYNPQKAVQLLAEAGWTKRNQAGWLVNDRGDVLRIKIGIPKVIEYRVTPYQQMLKDYGIDLQIKFMDGNALWKMLMERNFTITYENWGGLIFPNPETTFHSRLADKNNNNNLYGFKNERVDELCEAYDHEFNHQKRVEILREIDGIIADTRSSAWTLYRHDSIAFWNKFGYPEFLVDRYQGDYRSIYKYWWFDQEKLEQLIRAMDQNTSLPTGQVIVTYWRDYVTKVQSD